jgi:hypothetical protein
MGVASSVEIPSCVSQRSRVHVPTSCVCRGNRQTHHRVRVELLR